MDLEYNVSVNTFNITTDSRSYIWDSILKFITDILVRHFIAKDIKQFLSNLFEKEEIHERLSLIIEHRNFTLNLLGEAPKLFFNDWQNFLKPEKYITIRKTPVTYDIKIML